MEMELEIFKKIIKDYFRRLSVITTQVPNDLRPFLLPAYMLYKGYKSVIYIDPRIAPFCLMEDPRDLSSYRLV